MTSLCLRLNTLTFQIQKTSSSQSLAVSVNWEAKEMLELKTAAFCALRQLSSDMALVTKQEGLHYYWPRQITKRHMKFCKDSH